MVSLVIYGIIAIALASAAGYAFLVFTNSSKEVDYTLQNSLRMDSAVAGVRASMLSLTAGTANGGLLYAPMGVLLSDNQGGKYTGIPDSLGAVNTSPWGQPYAYCPLSPTNASGLATGGGNTVTAGVDVKSPPTANQYTVSTFTGVATSGIAYVIATNGTSAALTNAAADGYVAFILSSQGPGLTVPTCNAINYDTATKTYGVTGGVARGVNSALPYTQHAVASMDRMEIYVGTNPTNDGTGRDINNLASMDYAMSLWLSLQPRETTIWVTSNVSVDTSLNVEDSRLYSGLGEGAALTIASPNNSIPTLTLKTNLATYPNAYEFNSPITLENLIVNTNGPITATKPLTLKNVILDTQAANTAINVMGTTLLSENVWYKHLALTLTNSDGEFYNLRENGGSNASNFTASTINANASHLSFDGQVKIGSPNPTPTFVFDTTPQTNFTAIGSQINISPSTTLTTSATTDGMIIFDSNLTVQGTLTLGMTGGAARAGLDAIAGSGVFVSGTLANSTPNVMQYVTYLNGSTMGLEGMLTPNAPIKAAIGLQQSQLTSSTTTGKINQGGVPQAYACVDLIAGVAGMAPELLPGSTTTLTHFPIFAAGSGGTGAADKIYFSQAQYGMPPLADWQDTANGSLLDSNNAAYFNAASLRAPIVKNSVTTFPILPNNPIGYVDSTTLEVAIRNLVNAESITGSGLNFAGTCG